MGSKLQFAAVVLVICGLAFFARNRLVQSVKERGDGHEGTVEPDPGGEESARLRLAVYDAKGRLVREYSAQVRTVLAGRLLATLSRKAGEEEPPSAEVPAGPVRIEVHAGGPGITCYGPVSTQLRLKPGEDRLVELEAPAGGRLRLEVRALAERMADLKVILTPVAGGDSLEIERFLELESGAYEEISSLSAAKPAVCARLLEPGVYTLRVELPGYEPSQTEVRIIALEIAEAVVEPRLER